MGYATVVVLACLFTLILSPFALSHKNWNKTKDETNKQQSEGKGQVEGCEVLNGAVAKRQKPKAT